tara:strand:- start:4358 stop:4624 length:267 start_codon:yes stop_codon:yes gene_type:complete
MKIAKFCLLISSFIIIPSSVKADFDLLESSPAFDSVTTNSSFDTSLDKYRTSNNNWGSIGEDSEIDLSEWGGRVPTCSEAPGCPICTN